jgi:integrase
MLALTVEKPMRVLKRRTRMSFQQGLIEKKRNGKYLLRYRVRDANQPRGWRKVAELMEATTDKAAEKERDRRMREINSQNETIQATGVDAGVTLRKFSDGLWQSYLRNKGVKLSTVYGYQSLLKKHVLPALGDKKLSEITPSGVNEFLNGITQNREKSRGPKLLNVYSLLRQMFEVATEYDLIPASPVRKKLHRPKYKAKEKPALTPNQVGAILAKVPAEWYAFALAMALTSVRIGELIAIQWKDIDWTNARLALSKNVWRGKVQESTKTGAVAVRHLPEALLAALKMHRQKSKFVRPEDYVFTKSDGSLVDPDFLRRNVLYPAMDKAGIDRGLRTHGFHIFRHTGGSIVRAQTGDIKLAQVQLSHAPVVHDFGRLRSHE